MLSAPRMAVALEESAPGMTLAGADRAMDKIELAGSPAMTWRASKLV